MKIELGRRYKRRDGNVTEPIRYTQYPYFDQGHGLDYTVTGKLWSFEESQADLIEEYVEPVVVWCVLDNTGEIVKAMVKGLRDKRYLEQEWPGCRIIKLVEEKEVKDGNQD